MILKLFLVLVTLSTAMPIYAQIFKLTFTPDAALNPVAAAFIKSEVQKIETEINDGLPSAESPDRLLEGMANSSVIAGKGIGSDYASNMSVLLIGAGVGVGVDLEKNKEADTDLSGAGVQGGLILGTNLGWMDTKSIFGLDTDKLNVYLNFMSYKHEMNTGDTKAKIDLASYGVHFSYNWINGSGSKWLGWGGVKVHWGYEFNKTTLKFSSEITETLNQTSAGTTYNANIVANPFAAIDVTTHSIPLEISSSVQILYILSLYGGLGADYNTGTATGKGDINSSTAAVSCTVTAPCPTGDAGDIDTTANIDGKGKASPFTFRGFAGVQVNLPFIRVFVQADKALGSELVGATVGVRLVF